MQKCHALCVVCQMLIPIHMGQSSPKKAGEAGNESSVMAANKAATTATTSNKPKRTGSLALFFRKVSTLLNTSIVCVMLIIFSIC